MSQSNFPVILYDIENNSLPINFISKSNNFYLRSYQLFSIEIINNQSNNTIYSVKENPNSTGPNDLFLINNQNSFVLDNFGYTLYLENDCTIIVKGIDNISRIYNITLKLDNVLNEEQSHYNDLLTNNYLPNFDELEPAIINGDKAEMIKRLLLDYKNILIKKGTIKGIEKFLNLIGFDPQSIKIYAEFKTPNNQITLTPDTTKDIKTGYYHLLYDNWNYNINDYYTNKNLPKRIIAQNDLEEFFKRLYYAILLANKYFTLPEQDISFFGLNNSVNVEKYLSIAGNTTIVDDFDVHNFRKNINIKLLNYQNSNNFTYLVKNNLQINQDVFNSEIKTYSNSQQLNDELYLVDLEIFDDYIPSNINQLDIKSLFGNLIHLKINAINNYCEYEIEKIGNPLSKIISDKFLLTEELHLRIVSKLIGNYKITINIYDKHNNREKYVYYYNVKNNINRIDFEIYNSTNIYPISGFLGSHLPINFDTNKLNLDIESSWITTNQQEILEQINSTYILPNNEIPLTLDNYYNQNLTNIILKYLSENNRFKINELNRNFIVDKSTETIPVDFLDNWLEIISFPYNNGYLLKLKIIDEFTQEISFVDYFDNNLIGTSNEPKDLFITVMDIYNNQLNIDEPYIYISTTSGGINLIPELYDLWLIPDPSLLVYINNIPQPISIYSLLNLTKSKIPLNFDFPLFFRKSNLLPDFISYPINLPVSPENYIFNLDKVRSLFPRLYNIEQNNESYNLKLGDIFICRPNPNYITNLTDIKWSILNTFTNEIIYTTTDFMLKYRVIDNIIFTIKLQFKIEGINYEIIKPSIQSSFE